MNENPFTLMFGKEPYLTIRRDHIVSKFSSAPPTARFIALSGQGGQETKKPKRSYFAKPSIDDSRPLIKWKLFPIFHSPVIQTPFIHIVITFVIYIIEQIVLDNEISRIVVDI